MLMRCLSPRDGLTLQNVARRIRRERIGYLDNYLAFAMRAKALLASVLIFDFERMPVGTFALNSHVRPASRTVEDLEKDAKCCESASRVRRLTPRSQLLDPCYSASVSDSG